MLERRIYNAEELTNILVKDFNLNVSYDRCIRIIDAIIREDHLLEITQDNKILILKNTQARMLYYNENNINDLVDIAILVRDLKRNNITGLHSNLVNSYYMIDPAHTTKVSELLRDNNIPYIYETNPGILYANKLLSDYYLDNLMDFNYNTINLKDSEELFRKVDKLVEEQQVVRDLFKRRGDNNVR